MNYQGLTKMSASMIFLHCVFWLNSIMIRPWGKEIIFIIYKVTQINPEYNKLLRPYQNVCVHNSLSLHIPVDQ